MLKSLSITTAKSTANKWDAELVIEQDGHLLSFCAGFPNFEAVLAWVAQAHAFYKSYDRVQVSCPAEEQAKE